MNISLRGYPFLISASMLHRDIMDMDRHIFWEKVEAGDFPLLVWVKIGDRMRKVTKPSLEKQLEALRLREEK